MTAPLMPDWMRPVDQYQEAMDYEANAQYDRYDGWGDPDNNDGWVNEPADPSNDVQGPPPPPPNEQQYDPPGPNDIPF